MSPLFAPLEWHGWGKDQGITQKREAERKEERSQWLSASVAFIAEGHSSLQLAGEAPAHSSAISTSKGLGGGGSGSLYFCSEATFQDDVVAIAALGF